MNNYKSEITLIKNARGCYMLDTIKGCSICKHRVNGCYNDCYAKGIAKRYVYDFTKPVKRDFIKDNRQLYLSGFYDTKHIGNIVRKIKKVDMPFVRIGEMGDPSEDWEHTINICREISISKKPIVIITKHWKPIQAYLLNDIKKLNICINTSISALDSNNEINYRLNQFNRLKKYCNSVLRVISCDFNNNSEGLKRSKIQEQLFNNNKIIDTVFRPSLKNPLVLNEVINIKKVKFLKCYVNASVFNNDTHLGYCKNCKDMCGITLD